MPSSSEYRARPCVCHLWVAVRHGRCCGVNPGADDAAACSRKHDGLMSHVKRPRCRIGRLVEAYPISPARSCATHDSVRSDALRRTAVDVLAALQSDEARVELRNARDAIAAAADGPLPDTDRPLTTDLLSRIHAALDPHFP